MTLRRRGQTGPEIAELQTQLERLGYPLDADDRGGFGPATEAAVRAFQTSRGIGVDGIVGAVTARELADAGWTLGDRLLYLRRPLVRGDDVRALQDQLMTLGFDPGRIDGIFGPDTDHGLRDFQRNYGQTVDGVCGVETVRALRGLPSKGGDTHIGPLREREGMLPRSGGLAGLRVFLDPGPSGEEASAADVDLAFGGVPRFDETLPLAIADALTAALVAAGATVDRSRAPGAFPGDSDRARLANALDAELVIALRIAPDLVPNTARASSFGHDRYRSFCGRAAAELAALALEGDAGITLCTLALRTIPILRETRACAFVLDFAPDADIEACVRALVAAITEAANLGAIGASATSR